MEFIAITAVILGLFFLQNQLYKSYAFKNLEYRCTLSTDECYEGDEIELVEEIVNKKWLPLPWLKAEITTSRWLSFAGAQSAVSDSTRFVPSFFSIKGYSRVTRRWKVKALKRGDFGIEQVVLITTDLLGYSNLSMSGMSAANGKTRVLVLPKAIDSDAVTVTPRYLNGDIMVKRQLLDDPFYISGVREYTGHEPMSRIHWPATAQQQKIMVYNNDYTSRQSVTIILNMQSRPEEHLEVVDEGRMENGIRVCAGLFQTTLAGMPMRFMSNCTTDDSRSTTVTGEYWGEEYVVGLLELLARLQLRSTEDFGNYLAGISGSITSTDIVIVSGYLSQAMLDFAAGKARLGVHVRFFILGPIPEELGHEGFDVVPCVIDESAGRRVLRATEEQMQDYAAETEKEAAVS